MRLDDSRREKREFKGKIHSKSRPQARALTDIELVILSDDAF